MDAYVLDNGLHMDFFLGWTRGEKHEFAATLQDENGQKEDASSEPR